MVLVKKTLNFKTLVAITKNMMKNQYDTIELHGVDDQSYVTVSLVSQCLIKHKYVEITRLKTKTVQAMDEVPEKGGRYKKKQDADPDLRVVLQPRLVVHLKKTPQFDESYENFEKILKNVEEEHAEDLAEQQE